MLLKSRDRTGALGDACFLFRTLQARERPGSRSDRYILEALGRAFVVPLRIRVYRKATAPKRQADSGRQTGRRRARITELFLLHSLGHLITLFALEGVVLGALQAPCRHSAF